jgi:hypothetical protein
MKVIKPKFKVKLNYLSPATRVEIEKWCVNHIGKRWNIADTVLPDNESYLFCEEGNWTCYWEGPLVDHGTAFQFAFVNHADAMMFSLRWL